MKLLSLPKIIHFILETEIKNISLLNEELRNEVKKFFKKFREFSDSTEYTDNQIEDYLNEFWEIKQKNYGEFTKDNINGISQTLNDDKQKI